MKKLTTAGAFMVLALIFSILAPGPVPVFATTTPQLISISPNPIAQGMVMNILGVNIATSSTLLVDGSPATSSFPGNYPGWGTTTVTYVATQTGNGPHSLYFATSTWTNASNVMNFSVQNNPTIMSPVTIRSGASTTVTFSAPPNSISSKLKIVCPAGLALFSVLNQNICNVFITLATTTTSYHIASSSLMATSSKIAVPNYYIYKADRPLFGIGVTTSITVTP